MPATELSAINDRLRRAQTETDARAAISHLSPEEFVRYLARNAVAHRRRSTLQTVAPAAIVGAFLTILTPAFLLKFFTIYRAESSPLWPILCLMTLFHVPWILRWASVGGIIRRNHPATQFPETVARAVGEIVFLESVPDLLILYKSSLYGAGSLSRANPGPIATPLRNALLRLLPRVTPGDAADFSPETVALLKEMVAIRKPNDPEMAVVAWLALSALAGENPESYADLSTTAARFSLASQSEHVRAAAEAFQETVNRQNRKA